MSEMKVNKAATMSFERKLGLSSLGSNIICTYPPAQGDQSRARIADGAPNGFRVIQQSLTRDIQEILQSPDFQSVLLTGRFDRSLAGDETSTCCQLCSFLRNIRFAVRYTTRQIRYRCLSFLLCFHRKVLPFWLYN